MSIKPLIFILIAVYFMIFCEFFNSDVNNPAMIIITHWPIAKLNNKSIEKIIFVDIVATVIMLARIGVEQGLEAMAKIVPTKNGITKTLPFLFCGIFFIKLGVGNSIISNKLKPKIIKIEAISKITIGDAILEKTFPVIAQKTPMILNTVESPIEKDISCNNNFLWWFLEYPPT